MQHRDTDGDTNACNGPATPSFVQVESGGGGFRGATTGSPGPWMVIEPKVALSPWTSAISWDGTSGFAPNERVSCWTT